MNITYSHDDIEQMRRHYEAQADAMKTALEVQRLLLDEAVAKAVRERTLRIHGFLRTIMGENAQFYAGCLEVEYPECFHEEDK